MHLSCPLHPHRLAKRRCFQCRRAICFECEHRARHHLYCSPACARRGFVRQQAAAVRERLAGPVPARWALLGLTIALLAPALYAFRIVEELSALATVPPSVAAPRRNRAAFAAIERVSPSPRGATVEGTATEGGAVFLFARGRFVAVTAVEGGHFRFERVTAPGPYRTGALALSPIAPLPAGLPPPEQARASGAQTGPHAPLFAPDLSQGPADRREVVLSFDAGASDRGASAILDILRDRSVRTTIFLTGDFIRKYPELVRRIARDGHEVGNHTNNHPHLTTVSQNGRQATRPGVTKELVQEELRRAAEAYRAITGSAMAPIWRAPYGEQNAQLRAWALAAGYAHVGWTQGTRGGLDSLDWVADPSSPRYRASADVVRRLLANARNGGIILMHLGTERGDDPIRERLPQLLDGLEQRGFQLARATEFLARVSASSTVSALSR